MSYDNKIFFYDRELDRAIPVPDLSTIPDLETTEDCGVGRVVKVMEQVSFSCKVATEHLIRLKETLDTMIPDIPKRVIYLAKHGKPRVRKKNMRRILKYEV